MLEVMLTVSTREGRALVSEQMASYLADFQQIYWKVFSFQEVFNIYGA
jgi:hypothetical protein